VCHFGTQSGEAPQLRLKNTSLGVLIRGVT
jgi:hypothetical protein